MISSNSSIQNDLATSSQGDPSIPRFDYLLLNRFPNFEDSLYLFST